jgi:uncharacterized membrane protein HdeD (DUF308 family)
VTRNRVNLILSGVLVVLGVVVLVETAVVGGGLGYLIGVLMILAGGLRIFLETRTRG